MDQGRDELTEPETILMAAVAHDAHQRTVEKVAAELKTDRRTAERKINGGRWFRRLIRERDLWASTVLVYRLRALDDISALRPIWSEIATAARTIIQQVAADVRLRMNSELARQRHADIRPARTRETREQARAFHEALAGAMMVIRSKVARVVTKDMDAALVKINPAVQWRALKPSLKAATELVIAFHPLLRGIPRQVPVMREEDLTVFAARGRGGRTRSRTRKRAPDKRPATSSVRIEPATSPAAATTTEESQNETLLTAPSPLPSPQGSG